MNFSLRNEDADLLLCKNIHRLLEKEGSTSGKKPRVGSRGWEDPLEEGMATHSSTLAWRFPWTEEPGGIQSIELYRLRHDWSNLACMHTEQEILHFKGFVYLPLPFSMSLATHPNVMLQHNVSKCLEVFLDLLVNWNNCHSYTMNCAPSPQSICSSPNPCYSECDCS